MSNYKKKGPRDLNKKSISELQATLDYEFAKKIRNRDKICIIKMYAPEYCVCKPGDVLQCGHYIHKGNTSLRWDPINCNAQGKSCNFLHESNEIGYMVALKMKYGKKVFDDLENRSNPVFKPGRQWYIDQIKKYRQLNKEDKNV